MEAGEAKTVHGEHTKPQKGKDSFCHQARGACKQISVALKTETYSTEALHAAQLLF